MVVLVHLLSQHSDPGGEGSATNARNGEEFDHTGEEGALAHDGRFFDELSVDVV